MAEIGRNDACPCGSGKKYKKCCLAAPPGEAMLKRQYALLGVVSSYIMGHPRCVDASGGRFRCNDAFRNFVIGLREQHADLEIERFTETIQVPLDALKAWLVADGRGTFDELSNSVATSSTRAASTRPLRSARESSANTPRRSPSSSALRWCTKREASGRSPPRTTGARSPLPTCQTSETASTTPCEPISESDSLT